MTSPIYGHAEFRISANGSLLYAPGAAWGSDYRIVRVDREGRPEPLIETPRAYSHFRLSPDRRTLAPAIEGASIGLWLHDLDRGVQTRFSTGYNNAIRSGLPTAIAWRSRGRARREARCTGAAQEERPIPREPVSSGTGGVSYDVEVTIERKRSGNQ